MTFCKNFHVVGIGIKNTSAIAFMSTNRCSWPHDSPILDKIWRCVASTTACTAIVVDGIVEWHCNNTAIAHTRIRTGRPFHFESYRYYYLLYSLFYSWRNCSYPHTWARDNLWSMVYFLPPHLLPQYGKIQNVHRLWRILGILSVYDFRLEVISKRARAQL